MWRCCAREPPSGEALPLRKSANGALDPAAPVDIFTVRTCGYLLQYFAVGLIYGGLPGTTYGLFICYLNVPSYVANASTTLATFPWSLKIIFAVLSDVMPIGGYRRRPWMMVGWVICTIFLIALASIPLPEPYYCFGANGRYDLHKVCNESAASDGYPFAILMMLAACGYVLADVAADGLTVSYARREAQATRGRTQTTAYLVRTIGQICAGLLVGLGMNGPEYEGTFGGGLSFGAVCAILSVASAAMVPISWLLIDEPVTAPPDASHSWPVGKGEEEDAVAPSARAFFTSAWALFESGALLEVVLYQVRLVHVVTCPPRRSPNLILTLCKVACLLTARCPSIGSHFQYRWTR